MLNHRYDRDSVGVHGSPSLSGSAPQGPGSVLTHSPQLVIARPGLMGAEQVYFSREVPEKVAGTCYRNPSCSTARSLGPSGKERGKRGELGEGEAS